MIKASDRIVVPSATVARRIDPSSAVLAVLALAVLILVGLPLIRLLVSSFSSASGLTLQNYATALANRRYIDAHLLGAAMGVVATILAVLMGVPLALGVSRTNMPARGAVHLSVMAALIMPPFLGTIAWMLLASPNAGVLNHVWEALFRQATGPFNVYSFWGLAFVIALYAFPLVYIFTKSSLDLISSELEDAAHIHGAGRTYTLWRVILPLALPAILGAAILVFLEAITLYGTPTLIAIPAGLNVTTVQISEFFNYPIQVEVASAYAMPIIVLTIALLYAQKRVLSRKGYVSISGKGGERIASDIGVAKWGFLAYAALIAALAVLLPLMILLSAASAKVWEDGVSPGNFTFANFGTVLFGLPGAVQALLNTFVYSLATAAACLILGVCIAYAVVRRLIPYPRLVRFVALAPVAVPGIILAIGLYAAYAGPPFSLYGTGMLIVVGFTTRFLPVAFTASEAMVQSQNPELEEAALILGGSRLTAIRRIVAPLLKNAMLGAFILIFISCTRELSTAAFLTGPNTRVASIFTLDLSEQGSYGTLSAMGIILIALTGIVVLIGVRVAGRDFMLRRK